MTQPVGKLVKTSSESLVCGLIVLGAGFRESAIRGVMTTISSLRAASHPRKVVRYEQEGVRLGVIVVGSAS